MSTTALTTVTPAPAIKRRFQLTGFADNHNKTWDLELWPLAGGRFRLRTTWGRVGQGTQTSEKEVTQREVDRLVAAKLRKGYTELTLHVPTAVAAPSTTVVVPAAPRHSRVTALVGTIFSEAGEAVKSYLAAPVDALSQEQIAKGREKLEEIQVYMRQATGSPTGTVPAGTLMAGGGAVLQMVTDYYNLIPTQLPRNLRNASVMDRVVNEFCADYSVQEDRLNQLEAALATFTASDGATGPDYYTLLGADIRLLQPNDPERERIVRFVTDGLVHGYRARIHDVFAVTIPSERAAYEASAIGKSTRLMLTHGTNNANIRHILHEKGPGSGLRIPRSFTNGWMFGAGVYYASVASKSLNYCRSRNPQTPYLMLLSEVAVGRMYEAADSMSSLRAAPPGYDSVWGRAGRTGSWGGGLAHDEIIVYRQEQQTIRYLITIERA